MTDLMIWRHWFENCTRGGCQLSAPKVTELIRVLEKAGRRIAFLEDENMILQAQLRTAGRGADHEPDGV